MEMIAQFIKANWFMLGLIIIPLITIFDATNVVVNPGIWLKAHHGPDLVIILIFLLSGMALNTRQLRDGVADIKGTLLALLLIFIIAPAIASFISLLPLQTGLIIGLLLVSAMPTTLSSGVVMTGSSGGNMAHALFITIIANSLAVVAIPFVLTLLFNSIGATQVIEVDQLTIMVKLASRVLLPLFIGILLRNYLTNIIRHLLPFTTRGNQICILIMVWMAVCAGREAIISGLAEIIPVILIVFSFHLFLVMSAILLVKLFKVAKGKRESIIFMGGQKTLPLSVILQVSLFPDYGIALVVCVMHHIIHLIMDASLINYLKRKN